MNTSLKRHEFALNLSMAVYLLLCIAALFSNLAGEVFVRAGMLFGLALLAWALLLGLLNFLEGRRLKLRFPYQAGDLIRVGVCIQILSLFPIASFGGNIVLLLVLIAVLLTFSSFIAIHSLLDQSDDSNESIPHCAEWLFGFGLLVFIAFQVPLTAVISSHDREVIGHPREPASYTVSSPIRLANMRTLNETKAYADLEITTTDDSRNIRIVSLNHKDGRTTFIKANRKQVRFNIPVKAIDQSGKEWVVTLLETKTPLEREMPSW